MFYFRKLAVITLALLTAWNAAPHLACRCSNGDIKYFCPKLGQSVCEATAPAPKSCCGGSSQSSCGCCASKTSSEKPVECCSAGCHCTPVVVSSATAPIVKKVQAVAPTQLVAVVTVVWMPAFTRPVQTFQQVDPLVPDDIIVRCERWLI